MEIARGDLVTIAVAGDDGKPRPVLVVQADAFRDIGSVTVLRLTGELYDTPAVRVTMEPEPANGLRKRSQVMIDKATSVPRKRIGRADPAIMRAVDIALARFLGLARAAV
jgi:mRNA interferase MazF